MKAGIKSWVPPKCGEFIDYLRNVETPKKRFCLMELVS